MAPNKSTAAKKAPAKAPASTSAADDFDPTGEFPKMLYGKKGAQTIAKHREHQDALGPDWKEHPDEV